MEAITKEGFCMDIDTLLEMRNNHEDNLDRLIRECATWQGVERIRGALTAFNLLLQIKEINVRLTPTIEP